MSFSAFLFPSVQRQMELAKKESELRRQKTLLEEKAAKAAKEAEEQRIRELEAMKAKALQEKHKLAREAFLREKEAREKEAEETREREGRRKRKQRERESGASRPSLYLVIFPVLVFVFQLSDEEERNWCVLQKRKRLNERKRRVKLDG